MKHNYIICETVGLSRRVLVIAEEFLWLIHSEKSLEQIHGGCYFVFKFGLTILLYQWQVLEVV